LGLFLVVILCSLVAFGEKIADIHPSNYLTDLAGVIDPGTAARINAWCADVERKTGVQIAVVTVRSLEGESVENYTVDLFKQLGVGKKDNRGVLLLLAPQERRYRLEVGYGLEPTITDARAGDIGREVVPLLRQNRYGLAVELAVHRLGNLVGADESRTSLPSTRAAVRTSAIRIPWWILPLGIFFVINFVLRVIRAAAGGGRRGSTGLWWIGPGGGFGGGLGGGSWGGGFGGSSGGFGGFGGGESGGGGASGSW
jgi:uncharacterized protein